MTTEAKQHEHVPEGLPALERRLAHDLDCLGWPAPAWMPEPAQEDGRPVFDVAIIGGGQAGLAAAAALARNGIQAVVFDRAPRGLEGPWATTARMETLRTVKELVGPALGVPALTFRAWFEAQHGRRAWTRLDKIPRMQWMEYLRWYRRVMAIDLRNDHELRAITPRADGRVGFTLQTPSGLIHRLARRVVLATGRDGLGGPVLPSFVHGLDRAVWAHSSFPMDYTCLRDRRVGVVGAGASAMDSAASALEAGASSVDLLIRRSDIPRINKAKGTIVPGLNHGHAMLSNTQQWQIRQYVNAAGVPPPRDSTRRVSRHAHARFNFAADVLSVEPRGRILHVSTPNRVFELDFLIVSTGFQVDWHRRPEYTAIAPHVRSWQDNFRPPPGTEDRELSRLPDLGATFELQEKTPGCCPGLDRIHCFCYPAVLSHGVQPGEIPGISDGANRLSNGMAGLFYRDDFAYHFARLQAFDEPELLGDEWTPA